MREQIPVDAQLGLPDNDDHALHAEPCSNVENKTWLPPIM